MADLGSKGEALHQKFLQFHNRLPYYYYVFVILLLLWGFLYLIGWLHYLIIWYVFCLFFSPQASWEVIFTLIKGAASPIPGFPWTYNITAFGILFSRVLLLYPIETAMYYIDEIFFSGYKSTVIKDPFAIIGQPRSGTTKFESVLEGDEDLVCLKFYEMRWPYLCYQYGVDLIAHIDSTYLNGAIEKFARANNLFHVNPEEGSERASMRRLRYDMADEDDIIFLFHFFMHFMVMSVVPNSFTISFAHHFDRLSSLERKRMLNFHKKCIQKVMYRRGQGKRYFAKWVLTWCGVMQEAIEVYPDIKFLVMVRKPQEQLRSWFKLQGLLSLDLTGYNILQKKDILEEVKKINIEFYNNQIKLLKDLPVEKRMIFNFHTFYNDIQQNTKIAYAFLGKDILPDSKFDKFLREQTQKQLTHKSTATDDTYFTDAEIKERFPDLMEVFFSAESKKEK